MIPDSACTATAPVTTDLGTQPVRPADSWQQELANAVRDPVQLLQLLNLQDPELRVWAEKAAKLFPLCATHSFIQRMRKSDPTDPLLLQVLPIHSELEAVSGFNSDPVGDLQAMQVPGLLQKYHGRALLITTGACAVHCRYCFRRAFPYANASFKPAYWQQIQRALQADTSLEEVILSGGDPLTLSNDKLRYIILDLLAAIPHIRRIRIHSRLPVVLPSRINQPLLDLFQNPRFRFIHVIHSNHANEIDASVAHAVSRLRATGGLVLNQAVLLKGINDSVTALMQLSTALVEIGVLPYYLHLLDRVEGAHHFEVGAEIAVQLLKTLQIKLPGYMVPKLAREEAGKPGKTILAI